MHPIPTHEPPPNPPNPAYTRPPRVPTRSQLAPGHWPWQAGKRNETGQQGGQSLSYFNEVDFCFLHEHRKHSNRLGFASGGCFIFCYISSFLPQTVAGSLPSRHAASLVPLLSIALLFFINKLYIYIYNYCRPLVLCLSVFGVTRLVLVVRPALGNK